MPEQDGIPYTKRNRLAVASLLMPILGVALFALSFKWHHSTPIGRAVILAGFAAGAAEIIFAITALIQMRGGRGRLSDRRIAKYGLLLAILIVMPGGVIIPEMGCSQILFKQRVECNMHMRALCLAMIQYSNDHNECFPPPSRWNDAIRRYVKSPEVWICPEVGGDMPTYAMNSRLEGLRWGDVADLQNIVMLFESSPGKNLSGGPEMMPSPQRHLSTETIGFADGHAKSVNDHVRKRLNWDPKRDIYQPER